MAANSYYVSNKSGSLDMHLALIDRAFVRSEIASRDRLGLENVEVLIVEDSTQVIPEWGMGGTTWGPHLVVVALDPSFDLKENELVATLVHEMHHTMRWRGPGCDGSLAQMLVSEGLATLFEEEVVGTAPPWVGLVMKGEHMQLAEAALFDATFNQSEWFFGAGDLPRWFGYSYGYRRVKEYARRKGRTAAELVTTPSIEILSNVDDIASRSAIP